MEFKMDVTLPATAAEIWGIFFDVRRVATLIPGCEDVVEVAPFREYSAVMKQRIGPFKLEVPTRIAVESYTPERDVALRAQGRDKLTGTTLNVVFNVGIAPHAEAGSRLDVNATLQVAGRLASLGYPVVKKRSEEIFTEFEKRLRAELAQFGPGSEAESA
jgi:carbon monoxide dehydrogenase subunit G